jgi:excisionase family DNA binding protein
MPKKIVCTPCKSSISIADQIEAVNHAMKVKELAPMLDMSPTKLYNLARDGRIPSYRIAGSVRFDPHAVAVWLRASECKVA